MRSARVAAAVLALVSAALLLQAHLVLAPVAVTARELHEDLPPAGSEVIVTTDAAQAVGEEGPFTLVLLDDYGRYVLRVAGPVELTPPGYGRLHVFDGSLGPQAVWAPRTVEVEGEPREVLLLEDAWFEQDRPQEAPAPWLALAATAAAGLALVGFGAAYGLAGATAALGFLTHHALALSNQLGLRWLLTMGIGVAALTALALLPLGIARERWRRAAPAAVLVAAYGAGWFVEKWLLEGYRPFTGVL